VRILLRTSREQSRAWQQALRSALPEAELAVWPDVPFAPDYVAAWKPSAALFERVPRPKAIFNLGAGVDALMGMPNLPPGVPVIRLEDAGMARQMAEYVTLAVLAAFRQRAAYRALQRERTWRQLPQPEAGDCPVGFLGLGVLGRACAEALRPFGFPLLAWTRAPREATGIATCCGDEGLATLLGAARVLVCLLPLTPATRGLLDAQRLGALPRGAHVVNVARGGIVVDADLLALLDAGHLAGATLDVFDEEPLPAAHPFWHHPKIVLTPHVSAVTRVEASARQVAEKIRSLERGEPVSGVVDRQRGY
jgi:glyoxylate/hydroxypyruvate reductase A